MKYGLKILFILNSVEGGMEPVTPGSGAALGSRICALRFALLAELYAAKCADDADEGPAVRARVTFRRALLVPAGPAYHRIAFTEDLAHVWIIVVRVPEESAQHREALNLHQGPHFTTRLAACSQVDNRSGPASCQSGGTGASRFFSPSLSKQSQPWLNSLATVTLR
jgi:hypothetical protein